MHKIRFLHIGDIHLGREFGESSGRAFDYSLRREEIWKSFERALDFATRNYVDLVLISGDLYENSTMNLSNFDRLAYLFRKYSNMVFIISLGNHDHLSEKSDYLKSICPDNVFIFGNYLEYIELKNYVRIYGFSWDRSEYKSFKMPRLRLDQNYINLLSIHGTVASSSDYLPLNIDDLEDMGFDYIALSHIHKPGQIGKRTFYSGCLESMSFNDLGDRGGYLVDIDSSHFSYKFINFTQRQYFDLEFDLSDLESNSKLFLALDEFLQDIGSENFIRLRLIGENSDLDLMKAREILSEKFFYFELVDMTSSILDLDLLAKENEYNLLGKYLKYIRDNYGGREEKALIELALEAFPWRDKNEA